MSYVAHANPSKVLFSIEYSLITLVLVLEKEMRQRIIRFLTIAKIIPLKLCLKQWCWLLAKVGRI